MASPSRWTLRFADVEGNPGFASPNPSYACYRGRNPGLQIRVTQVSLRLRRLPLLCKKIVMNVLADSNDESHQLLSVQAMIDLDRRLLSKTSCLSGYRDTQKSAPRPNAIPSAWHIPSRLTR